tara:strand:+ start:99 stop:365 length:267 start_codon:yes stop_codon:yes gene_type:complete
MLWPFFFAKNGHVWGQLFFLPFFILLLKNYIYFLTLLWSGRFFTLFLEVQKFHHISTNISQISQKYFQKNVKKTARPKPIREYFYKLF